MKIAVITINGETISQHFGRSPHYKIFEIQENKIVGEELRERKTGHFAPKSAQMEHHHGPLHDLGSKEHGISEHSKEKHRAMAKEISDCAVLIAGGMGRGAFENFTSAGLEVIMTDKSSIKETINDYLLGNLINLKQNRTH